MGSRPMPLGCCRQGRPTAGDVMDLITLHQRATSGWTDLVTGVPNDRWDAPTPCRDWSVRDLVNHIVGEDRWTGPLLRGRTIAEVGDSLDGDLLGEDPARSSGDAATEATAAVA